MKWTHCSLRPHQRHSDAIPMEEIGDERCNVIYYCGGVEDDICELHHDTSPPEDLSGTEQEDPALGVIYCNIRSLLDEDQGGFNEGRS